MQTADDKALSDPGQPAGSLPMKGPAPALPAALDEVARASKWLDLPIAWADSQDQLLGANRAFEAAIGTGAAAAAGHSLSVLLQFTGPPGAAPTGSTEAWTRSVQAVDAQGQAWSGLLHCRCAPGGRVYTLSQRMNAATPAALALSQRLELATAAAGVGIWSAPVDAAGAAHWDTQMRRLHGIDNTEPAPSCQAYLQRFVHAEDRATLADSLALLIQRRQGHFDLDLRILRPDGQQRRLATRTTFGDSDGRPQLYGVMLDVTDRQVAEDRLIEVRERAALATRGVGIGTWESEADAQAGWWDEQMFQLRGLPPRSELLQTSDMLQWVHPDDRLPYQRMMQAALALDGPSHAEFRVIWPDGQQRWLASRSVPVRDVQGRTVRRIGINWDITDARDAAAAREERQLALRESQARSGLLARISHELRTPLNAVLGFSQLLLADGPDPATWRQRVSHMQAAGQYLLTLIDEVLELSSLESGELPLQLQPVDLAALVQACLPQVQPLAQAQGITLLAPPAAAAGWALADPVRLRQALLNLLSNGIRFNRPGGRVQVSVASEGTQPLLRVEDSGPGLSADQLAHLFEPFVRHGPARDGLGGSGIGLAIVRASVQQMGGQVRVNSQPGQGSCFEMLLRRSDPATPAAPAASSLPPLPNLPAREGPGCVLYIEDNEVNQMIVEALMQRRPDLRLVTALDGQSGLVRARSERPDLILLDMQLPDIDGPEVLQRLREDPATAAIPCIALSANAMPDDIDRALASGFDAYWTKPLEITEFWRAIDRMFGPVAA